MCKLMILTSGMVGLAYATEFFTALYSGNRYEQFAFINRALGPLAWGYWIMVACNVLIPQLFWFTRVRRTLLVGLRHLAPRQRRHVVRAVHHHRELAASATFCRRAGRRTAPTSIEIATLIGSFGLFFTCFLLFCRFVPVIAIAGDQGRAAAAPRHHDGARAITTAAYSASGDCRRRPMTGGSRQRLRARRRYSAGDQRPRGSKG